jgi:ParB-like chromosome segregation protein Spo0J
MKMKIEQRQTSSLIPYARNARTHSETQVAQIAGSIKEFGFNNPVLIDKDSGIIAGHGRVLAAQKLGLDAVPVIVLGHLTENQKRAYILADNKLALNAGWDEEMLAAESDALKTDGADLALLGFDDNELKKTAASLDAGDVSDAEPKTEKAEELQREWKTERGQLWKLGNHRLVCGDATDPRDLDTILNGSGIDCVFTSPPYAVGIDYGETYQDDIESLRAMLPKLAAEWAYRIKDGGFAVLNFGDIVSAKKMLGSAEPCEYPMALEYFHVFRAAHFTLWSRRVWCKPVARVAAPWTAQSNRSATNFEHVWTFKRPGVPAVGRVPGPMDSQTGWFDTTKTQGVEVGKETHGAGMPTSCAQWMINVHSAPGAIIHEPFLGTGTTLIACEQMGRSCRATEINPAFVAVSLQRYKDATGKTPELAK